ncbi:MiaB/RimO family radical SAM methylthiotransferase [Helicobacter trogontum]|uniref:MiaB/RimO family radical SAM methylthiotransferase n=1 Tax=Helicobacter trogontum TaxID=50960 RepID=A0A4U8SAR3_9HELI|nr:MiaB/RimO family radical SAM methylthiotransferase [Helicobacter trogontum]TLD83124.1 MiaB/RimO family radical SAM methylthiotransferase [Helicobacter trogontum]
MAKVYFKTFGCRSNLYDTQVMISNLKSHEVVASELEADTIIINSCTVTNKADREVRGYARKYSNEGKKVLFTGCGVKHSGEKLFKNGLVNGVFAHSHKESINDFLSNENRVFLPKEKVSKHVDTTLLPRVVGKVRAFIKIQEGCNFSCSYCIIPSVRGSARSFSESHILDQIKLLEQSGVTEVILTGTNIGSYGVDTRTHIATLIQKIHDISGILRIRLGSLEPSQIDSQFLEILELDKLERHLHIALQHTSQTMLTIMNRKNTFERDLELFHTIASKGFSLGTDYIVGHYGESEEIFKEAICNLEKLPLTHLHPFIYSPRFGTKSAKNELNLAQVKGDVAKDRLRKITKIVQEKNIAFRQNIKTPLHVLIEGKKVIHGVDSPKSTSYFVGLDEYFNKMLLPIADDSLDLKGKWISVSKYDIAGQYNIGLEYNIV